VVRSDHKPLLQSAVEDLKRLLLQNGYPQGIITFNINDVLNKKKNKPNEPTATVPKKDVTILLPYIALHSNHITKRLKSCVNRIYSFVKKTVSTNHNYPKSFIKLVAGTAMIFALGKRNEDRSRPENGTFQGPFET